MITTVHHSKYLHRLIGEAAVAGASHLDIYGKCVVVLFNNREHAEAFRTTCENNFLHTSLIELNPRLFRVTSENPDGAN